MHTPPKTPTEIVAFHTIAQKVEHQLKKIDDSVTEKKDEFEKNVATTEHDITKHSHEHIKLFKPIEDELLHLKKLVDDKVDEALAPLETRLTKRIANNVTKEEIKELKEELSNALKTLENRVTDDFKNVSKNFIYFGLGVTAALLLMALYS